MDRVLPSGSLLQERLPNKTRKAPRPEWGPAVLEPSTPALCLVTSPALPSSSFLSLIGSHPTTRSLNLTQINLVIVPWDEVSTCPEAPLDRGENRRSERASDSSRSDSGRITLLGTRIQALPLPKPSVLWVARRYQRVTSRWNPIGGGHLRFNV